MCACRQARSVNSGARASASPSPPVVHARTHARRTHGKIDHPHQPRHHHCVVPVPPHLQSLQFRHASGLDGAGGLMVLVGSLMVLCSGTKAGVAWWTVEQACKSNDGRTNLCANQQPCHQKSRSRPANTTTRSNALWRRPQYMYGIHTCTPGSLMQQHSHG